VDGLLTFVSRFDNNLKLLRRKGTLISFGNAPGAVPPLSSLGFAGRDAKLLRPGTMNHMVTPEGTHHSRLPPPSDAVSKGIVKVNIPANTPLWLRACNRPGQIRPVKSRRAS